MFDIEGLASSTVPMYIAECAPSHLRGRLVTLNNVFITGGQFIASLIAGAFSSDVQNGWR
jgi:MFS transporter, SP family, solute carrier family 2 (myo-inositol transporter), member 13